MVSIADQDRNVSFRDKPKYSLNIQKPESFTWLHIRLPAPTASTIRFGSTPVVSTSGVTMPAAVMPATAADFFGTPNAGAIYGAMIVAWSIGGVVGPLVAARLYESSGGYTLPFTVLGIVALVSSVLPLITRPPAARRPEAIDLRDRADAAEPA